MAFEGLNNAGELQKRLIVVLNDNDMSIAPNVGAIARYLTKLTTSRIYRRFERDVWDFLGKLPPGLARARGGAAHQGGPAEPGGPDRALRGAGLQVLRARSTATTSTCWWRP